MIIYSVSTAMEESIENKWVEFMEGTQIPMIMKTGLFVDYRFVRVVPSQGVDLTYNLQLRCKSHTELSQYRGQHEPMLERVVNQNFEGKLASFQSVLDQVSEEVFNPPPKVKSGVLRLTRREDPISCDHGKFKHVVKTAFNQRRKMLRKSLKPLYDSEVLAQEIFTKRPEQLSVDDFVSLVEMSK